MQSVRRTLNSFLNNNQNNNKQVQDEDINSSFYNVNFNSVNFPGVVITKFDFKTNGCFQTALLPGHLLGSAT